MASSANTATLGTNFNVSPYYDDFSEDKGFYRILFRPGMAVQARELTQMQTIIQNQIDRFGEHVFKEGSVVRDCATKYDSQYSYVKLRNLTSAGAAVNAASFSSLLVKGATSGVIALVLNTNDGSEANTPNFKTFFVKYVAANTTTGFRAFANNEILTCVTNSALSANTIKAAQGAATGFGSAITVASGIIFAKDHFIRTEEQTLILEKYSDRPSYRVGFDVEESIITSQSDTSLLDPASGSYNYQAPGANRLKLYPRLAKKSLTVTGANNFAELIQIKNGDVQKASDVPQYNLLRDYMAKRTADESGNYIVKGLSVRAREHLISGNNQGVFTSAQGGLATKLVIDVEPGKAYVQGYDNELLVTQHVQIDKATDYASVEQAAVLADFGQYLIVDNVVGNWDVNGQDQVTLRGRVAGSAQANAIQTGAFSTTSFPGASIGTARVRAVERLSGNPGVPSTTYKLYLTDIKITTSGKSFANVESVAFNAGSGQANGKADIRGSNNLNANTVDSAFDRAVFRIPAAAIKTLRDTSAAIDNDFEFIKAFDGSFDTSGQVTVNTGAADETFDGSGSLSSTLARGYHVVARASANTSNLTGTVTVTSSANTVTGSGTAFLTQVNAGDIIACSPTDVFVVSSVTNDTALTLTAGAAASRGGSFHKRFKQGQVLDLGGVGRDGARSINITSSTAALFDINETLGATLAATFYCKINKIDGQEATKAISRDHYVQLRIGNAAAGTSYAGNTTGPWPLGLADGYRVVSVSKQSGSNFASVSAGTDVTSHFTFDTGQRDSFYDHARLVKKSTSGLTIASGDRLLVKLDYFTHSNRQRGYFSIDSYPVNDATAGTDTTKIFTYQIPVFTSPGDGSAYDLRDCVDFRPRMTDSANAVTSLTNISVNPLLSTSFDEPTGGLHFPTVGSTFESDLDYYLKRNDVITMDKNGVLGSVRGTPGLNPITPNVDADKMPIARIELAPYPSLPDELGRRAGRMDLTNDLKKIKNDRFTMRDIGVIRDRVERLEYYTTLSLLEKEAKDMLIADTSGNNRFKNGFLVDAFTGHNVGNVYDGDYKISVDPSKREARPPVKLDNIELFYNAANSSSIVRTNVTVGGISRDQVLTVASGGTYSNGETITSGATTGYLRFQVGTKLYIENASGTFAAAANAVGGTSGANRTISAVSATTPGRLMTLPYEHERVLHQPYGATTRNIAGKFYNWAGVLSLDPNNDYWVDTTILPDVQINLDNNADNWLALANAWGTQWGSWETIATGIPVFTGSQQISQSTSGNSTVTINQETFTQQVTQQMLGTQLGVSVSQQSQSVGNLVKDVNIQPFMRSRVIKFTGRAFKPSARVYAFFDGVSVDNYITPTNSSFANTANEGFRLTSDGSGNIYGLLRIPNDASLRFRTGEKVFRLTDSSTNSSDTGLVTTAGQAIYASQGLITGTSELTIGTTQADVSLNSVLQTRSINQTITGFSTTINTVNDASPSPSDNRNEDQRGDRDGDNGRDPLAQTFTVPLGRFGHIDTSGGFLTKIDLFFSEKDSVQPCFVEIREVDKATGYPTPYLVPYARACLEPSQVNTSDDGSSPTPVYFPSPVYLVDGKQYSIVVKAGGNNPNYRVFVSRLGENDLISGTRISSQPAAGILFASSNDQAYSAIQEEDLKHSIYFAKFTVSTTGTLIVKNERKDYLTVANVSAAFIKMGEEVHGETLLHGTFANTKSVNTGVTYAQGMVSGATGTVSYYSTANGHLRVRNVSSTKFKGGERIRIRNTNATTGVIVGNSTGVIIGATYPTGRVSFYDALTASNTYVHLANVSFANSGPASGNNRAFLTNRWIKGQTNSYVARIVNLGSLNADLVNLKADFLSPSNTSIITTAKFAKSTSTRDTSYQRMNLNGDTEFPTRRYVHSRSIEANTALSASTMKDGSAEVKFALTTSNRYGSPAFDTSRVSLSVIENLINSNTDIQNTENNVKQGGTAKARYITRRVTLAEDQDAEDLKVFLDAYKPTGTQVNVFYKVLHAEDSDNFADARWIPMTLSTASTVVSDPEDRTDFRELEYTVAAYGSYNSGLFANSSPTNILRYRNTQNALFQGFKYFAIKIVLTSDLTNNPPRIRNLRAIALQK